MDDGETFKRGVHIDLRKEVWELAGCHEFLQGLNFKPSRQYFRGPLITLSCSVVKFDRKTVQLAITAIEAVFGE